MYVYIMTPYIVFEVNFGHSGEKWGISIILCENKRQIMKGNYFRLLVKACEVIFGAEEFFRHEMFLIEVCFS